MYVYFRILRGGKRNAKMCFGRDGHRDARLLEARSADVLDPLQTFCPDDGIHRRHVPEHIHLEVVVETLNSLYRYNTSPGILDGVSGLASYYHFGKSVVYFRFFGNNALMEGQ